MLKEENVVTLSKEEIKNIPDNIDYTASLASHLNKCIRIASSLTDEVNRYKDIAKKRRFELAENKTVTVENKPADSFSKEEFIAVYGEDEYKRFVHKKDRLYVTFNG